MAKTCDFDSWHTRELAKPKHAAGFLYEASATAIAEKDLGYFAQCIKDVAKARGVNQDSVLPEAYRYMRESVRKDFLENLNILIFRMDSVIRKADLQAAA